MKISEKMAALSQGVHSAVMDTDKIASDVKNHYDEILKLVNDKASTGGTSVRYTIGNYIVQYNGKTLDSSLRGKYIECIAAQLEACLIGDGFHVRSYIASSKIDRYAPSSYTFEIEWGVESQGPEKFPEKGFWESLFG